MKSGITPIFAGGLPAWLAFVLAALLSLALVWTGKEIPLLTLVGAAVFLFLVVEEDLRRSRIPNAIVVPAFLGALVFSVLAQGLHGLGLALAGAAAAFALLFPAFALRWMGAGDVKGLMVLGALFGPRMFLGSLWWMLIAGGLLAIGIVALRGYAGSMFRRFGQSLWLSLATQRLVYIGPADAAQARTGLPFGVAMGLGVVAYQVWGFPWA